MLRSLRSASNQQPFRLEADLPGEALGDRPREAGQEVEVAGDAAGSPASRSDGGRGSARRPRRPVRESRGRFGFEATAGSSSRSCR